MATAAQIEEYARQGYNAEGDDFYPATEIYRHILEAQMALATEALCIESVFTASTVASQQEYSFPTNAITIFRGTYDGYKMEYRTLDDLLEITEGSLTPSAGRPTDFAIWNNTLYLAPIPSEVKTIKIWANVEPQPITNAASELEVPSRYHYNIVDFVIAKMAAKDSNGPNASYHLELWKESLMKAIKKEKLLKQQSGITVVKNEDIGCG